MNKIITKYFGNLAYFYRTLSYRIFIKVVLSIAVGLLDGLGLAMFLPLLQMVGDSESADPGGLGNLSFLVEGMKMTGMSLNLLNVLIVLCVFFVLKGFATFISSMYEVNIKQYFVKNTRKRLTLLMSEMSYKSFVQSDVGIIQNALSAEVARLSTAFQQYFSTIQQTVMVFVYMLFAFLVDPKFTLLICIGGGLSSLIYRKIYKATKGASRSLTFGTNYYQGLIIQYVNSFKYLKATGLLNNYSKKFLYTIDNIEENNRKIGKFGAILSGTREPLLILIVSAVILLQVNVLGGTLSTILISLLFFYRALSALMFVQASYNGFLGVSGSMENVTKFENELSSSKEEDGKIEFDRFKESLVLKNAEFSYKDQLILKKINLHIQKNKTIAFVGESGSGKTTLVNVLAGLIPLDNGIMMIDGVDRKEFKISTYQSCIGYITQDPVIFNDTIFNNVTFWAIPSHENFKRFEQAIRKASLEEFVYSLPEKEQTELGNNGINLSGGQRQRISIARELYKEVDILILDEATSALDSETERNIQGNIEALKGQYTVLIVAHRLSTIKNADSIIIMNKGEIVEAGSFNDLLKSSSNFGKMVELQEL